jgi:dethiobiotin synthetase
LLVRAARTTGADAVGAKPFCCGPRTDVEILAQASDHVETLDAINPVWLKTPAAPRACEMLGEPAADVPRALTAVRDLAARHAQVFCEGAGGWLVPVAKDCTVADFAADLGWPVIVVVRNKLGAINHTLLTLESVRRRGLPLAGIILNDVDGQTDEATRTNRAILEESCGCPILVEIARGQTGPAALI